VQMHRPGIDAPGARAARDAVIPGAQVLNARIGQKFRQILRRLSGKGELHELVRMIRRVTAQDEPERPAAIAPALGLPCKLHVGGKCCHRGKNNVGARRAKPRA